MLRYAGKPRYNMERHSATNNYWVLKLAS